MHYIVSKAFFFGFNLALYDIMDSTQTLDLQCTVHTQYINSKKMPYD